MEKYNVQTIRTNKLRINRIYLEIRISFMLLKELFFYQI